MKKTKNISLVSLSILGLVSCQGTSSISPLGLEYDNGTYNIDTSISNKSSSAHYQIFVRSFCDSNNDGIGDFNGIASNFGRSFPNISTNRDLTSRSSFSRIALQRSIRLETLLMFIAIFRCSAIVGRSKLSFSSWFILMLLKVEPELSLANLSCNSAD